MTKISNIKNIILIGRTGKGKTTIANLISDADFEENNNSISGTKKTQTKIFSFEEKDYRVVDTIGIGDTKMKKENVLLEIARGCKITAKGGIAQILFVTGGKFTNEEIKVYNLIRNVFFNNKVDKDISNYTTIVRTNFNNFTSKEECEKDKRVLIEENDLIREIIENCQGKIIHINASSLDIRGNDVETIELEKKLSKRRRDLSREVILKELKNWKNAYLPKSLEEIDQRIEDSLTTELEKLENILKEKKLLLKLQKLTEKERSNLKKETTELEKEINNIRETVWEKLQYLVDNFCVIL